MRKLSTQAIEQNIKIFEEWLIPGFCKQAAINAMKSVARWKAELVRRGKPYDAKSVSCGGFINELIKMQKINRGRNENQTIIKR